MANKDLYVNKEALASTFSAIANDINLISNTISEAKSVMASLNSSVWKAKEKDKIDQEFVPYLNSFASEYPRYLKARLDFAVKSVGLHNDFDQMQSQLNEIKRFEEEMANVVSGKATSVDKL